MLEKVDQLIEVIHSNMAGQYLTINDSLSPLIQYRHQHAI